MCEFHPIDMQTWPMAQAFYYYTQMAPTGYTVNVNMDVTILRKELKSRGYKFFSTCIDLVSKAISKQQELRIGLKDDVLGVWDFLTPVYPQFHENDKATSLLWTEYNETFSEFYNQYISDTKQHGQSHGILAGKFLESDNKILMPLSITVHHATIEGYHLKSFLKNRKER